MFKVIKNAQVYTPSPIGKNDILICGSKIIKIAENIDPQPYDAKVIDAEGKIAVPGFIDEHVHITGGGGERGFSSKVPELMLSDIVSAGVTTIVGMLGTDSASRNVHNLLAKTKALNEEGITCFCLTGSYDYPSPTITGSVKNDVAFISEILGVKVCISDHRYPGITKSELVKTACAARVGALLAGKPGVVHMHMGRGKLGLSEIFEILEETDLPVKQFRPTHCNNNTPHAEKFANMGGYIDFTAIVTNDDAIDDISNMMGKVPNELITLSSDGNGSMPVWNDKQEMIGLSAGKISTLYQCVQMLMKKHNIALEKALPIITCNVADSLGFANKGRIETGKDADIVLLNPSLEIESVLALGRVMVDNGDVIVKGTFE